MSRRPPLNKNVREGLRSLAALVEAGSCADITGYDEEQLDAEGRKGWEEILQACRWIRSLPPES